MSSNKKECKKIYYENNKIAKGTTVSFIILFLAIYLSYNCNRGFKLSSLIYAVCFSPYYIIYRILKGVDKCFK